MNTTSSSASVRYHKLPIKGSDVVASSASSGSYATELTPDHDSEDSDLDLHGEHLHGFELLDHDPEKLGRRRRREGEELEEDDGQPGYTRRGSVSTTRSFQLYTPDEEKEIVKTFDRKLVFFVALLYMLSFLDRSNIGNAKIAGMDNDLNLHSYEYEWVLTSFYIAYIAFEWMSLLWKIIPAHIYISAIVLSWGLTASLQSCASSFASLIVLRVLLGIGEAGFTGIPYFLSFFYKKEELALRTGFFISAAPLAISFASSLAWLILKLGENGPIAPWRLLFLVEGFPSVLIALVAYYVIPDGPGKASYLTKRQKKVARLRLRRQKPAASDPVQSGLKWREVFQTLIDPKSWLTASMFFFTNMAFASMPVFLPTIIHSMGHSAVASQALSAPPYLISFICVILTAYLSDRQRSRSIFVIFHALLSFCGYAILAFAGHYNLSPWLRYAAIYPAAIGFFSVITIIITWSINNQESESKQGAAFAMLQLIGQCGPMLGIRLYPDEDAPGYVKGMAACAGAMIIVSILALMLRLYLGRLNRRNTDGGLEYEVVGKEDEGLVSGEDIRTKRFVYML